MKKPNSRFWLFTETRETSPTAPKSMNFYATRPEMSLHSNIVVRGTVKGNRVNAAFIATPAQRTTI